MKKVFLLTAWFVTTVCSAQVVIWKARWLMIRESLRVQTIHSMVR
jgi:hypothetical protein